MKINTIFFPVALLFSSVVFAQELQHSHPQTEQKPVVEDTNQGGITLQQLEQMALQQNPTLVQADAVVQVAEGRKTQSNLYPNPIVGVQLEELSQRDPTGQNDEHIFFTMEQTVLLGGKRGKAGNLFEQEKQLAQQNVEMQRLRVLNSVRILYYRLLGIQTEIQVRQRLAGVAEEAVGVTRELFNVGSADRPDLLEAEIESQSVQLGLASANNRLDNLRRQMAAVVGNPELVIARVAGSIDSNPPELDQEKLLSDLLSQSPQVKAAQVQVESRKAAIPLAQSEWVPDLRLRGGIGYNYETLESVGDPVGLEGFFEVAIPVPLFNRNQGKVASARAEQTSAEREVDRIRLELTAKFSTAFAEYLDAKTIAERYRNEMLPRAREAYDLYLESFQQMTAAYPQVLIAQRSQYQLEVDYVAAVTRQWVAALELQGSLLAGGALESPTMNLVTE